MSESSPLILVGVGTAGSAIASNVCRAFGDDLRLLLVDTDARTGDQDMPFALIGGDRLSGRGAGGDVVAGRLAAESSVRQLDEHFDGVRIAVIVTSLGGGTGGGVTYELAKHLSDRGIPTVVFATMPFAFEGEDRQRNARGIMTMIEDVANTTFFLPLDKLVQDEDNMDAALRRAIDTVASGVTLFWRLLEKPGYIRLDTERLRRLVSDAGRGRFATVTTQGPDRTSEAVDKLLRSQILSAASGPVNAILCGVLAGEDLRLSELGQLSDGIRSAFGNHHVFELSTVNDEDTFSGRLSVVVMLFEMRHKDKDAAPSPSGVMGGRKRKTKSGASAISQNRGRFNNAEPTIWQGEDLDIPTFVRKNIDIDV